MQVQKQKTNETIYQISKMLKTIKMKTMKTKFKFIPLVLISGLLIFTACDKDDDDPMPQPEEKNIVEVAQEAGQFSVLIQAAQKAGLADFLSTENNITVLHQQMMLLQHC